MIQLTRLRHGDTMYLNPDLFERVDTHVDTVVRMIDGTEYVVVEPAEEIVRRIVDLRARIIAIAGMLQSSASQRPGSNDEAVSFWPPTSPSARELPTVAPAATATPATQPTHEEAGPADSPDATTATAAPVAAAEEPS